MYVFIDCQLVPPFHIEVDNWDTVLTMKLKIEKSQGFPVSKQTLFFGSKVLQDNLDVIQCAIQPYSNLLLTISPDYNPNQNKDQGLQTEQSPSAPSNPVEVGRNNDQVLHQTEQSSFSLDSAVKELLGIQDSPVTVELGGGNQVLHQTEQSPLTFESVKEFLAIQDSSAMVEGQSNQVLHQTEQNPVPSYSFGETIFGEDRPLTTDHFSNIQNFCPVTTQEISYSQDSSAMVRSNNNESPVPSNPSEVIPGVQDLPSVTVRSSSSDNTKQVIQTEKPPQTDDSVIEIITIPDSPVKKRRKTNPMKLTVMVMPFQETRRIPVDVNAGDNVEELRKELAKIQERGELDLPPEGYIFIHNGFAMEDDQPFRYYDVSHGDTIEIFRATYGPTVSKVIPGPRRTIF